MSKKILDTEHIQNELAHSAFFERPPASRQDKADTGLSEKKRAPAAPATRPRPQKTSKEATTLAHKQARYQASMIEAVRKVVRLVGKEVAFVRLTPAEKQQLGDTVYTYKRQGIKTTENELLRIGLAFLLADYAENGKESVLARTIDALNS